MALGPRERPVLVAHSGAGPLLPELGRAISRPAAYVFVDAGLPMPGRSWMETSPPELREQLLRMVGDGWLPPWPEWWPPAELAAMLPDPQLRGAFVAGCPRLPLRMFEERRPALSRWPDAPVAYLQLSEPYVAAAAEARTLGWSVSVLQSHHLATLVSPELIASSLLQLLDAAGVRDTQPLSS